MKRYIVVCELPEMTEASRETLFRLAFEKVGGNLLRVEEDIQHEVVKLGKKPLIRHQDYKEYEG